MKQLSWQNCKKIARECEKAMKNSRNSPKIFAFFLDQNHSNKHTQKCPSHHKQNNCVTKNSAVIIKLMPLFFYHSTKIKLEIFLTSNIKLCSSAKIKKVNKIKRIKFPTVFVKLSRLIQLYKKGKKSLIQLTLWLPISKFLDKFCHINYTTFIDE